MQQQQFCCPDKGVDVMMLGFQMTSMILTSCQTDSVQMRYCHSRGGGGYLAKTPLNSLWILLRHEPTVAVYAARVDLPQQSCYARGNYPVPVQSRSCCRWCAGGPQGHLRCLYNQDLSGPGWRGWHFLQVEDRVIAPSPVTFTSAMAVGHGFGYMSPQVWVQRRILLDSVGGCVS